MLSDDPHPSFSRGLLLILPARRLREKTILSPPRKTPHDLSSVALLLSEFSCPADYVSLGSSATLSGCGGGASPNSCAALIGDSSLASTSGPKRLSAVGLARAGSAVSSPAKSAAAGEGAGCGLGRAAS